MGESFKIWGFFAWLFCPLKVSLFLVRTTKSHTGIVRIISEIIWDLQSFFSLKSKNVETNVLGVRNFGSFGSFRGFLFVSLHTGLENNKLSGKPRRAEGSKTASKGFPTPAVPFAGKCGRQGLFRANTNCEVLPTSITAFEPLHLRTTCAKSCRRVNPFGSGETSKGYRHFWPYRNQGQLQFCISHLRGG